MLSMQVVATQSFNNQNAVFVEGLIKSGNVKKGDILINQLDGKEFLVKGLVLLNISHIDDNRTHTMIFESGDYKPEDLIGKTLVSKII